MPTRSLATFMRPPAQARPRRAPSGIVAQPVTSVALLKMSVKTMSA